MKKKKLLPEEQIPSSKELTFIEKGANKKLDFSSRNVHLKGHRYTPERERERVRERGGSEREQSLSTLNC